MLELEKQLVVDYCRKILDSHLTSGMGGNISVFNRIEGLIAISPSGIDYYQMNCDDVVIINLQGDIIEGRRKPSSELHLHLEFYSKRTDVNAVIHAHSIYATIFACLRQNIMPVSYMLGLLGTYDIKCAPYKTFGTKELAEVAYEYCGDNYAVLLANHGTVTCGATIDLAYLYAVNLEYVAELQYRAMSIGKPFILSEEEMAEFAKGYQNYGQSK